MASDEIGGCCDLNHKMGVLKGERDTWHAARAWQAFRDWLNGAGEQPRSLQYLIDRIDVALSLRAWQHFRDFLNGTPGQWQARAVKAYNRGLLAGTPLRFGDGR